MGHIGHMALDCFCSWMSLLLLPLVFCSLYLASFISVHFAVLAGGFVCLACMPGLVNIAISIDALLVRMQASGHG